MLNIGAESTTYSHYITPNEHNPNHFNSNTILIPQKDIEHTPGEILHIRAGKDVVHIEGTTGDNLLLELSSMPRFSQVWFFAKSNLKALYSASGKVNSARAVHCLKALSLLEENEENSDIYETYSHHKDHYVRWAAMQHLMEVNPKKSWDRLLELKNDPHPHIRNAVKKVFSKTLVGGE